MMRSNWRNYFEQTDGLVLVYLKELILQFFNMQTNFNTNMTLVVQI